MLPCLPSSTSLGIDVSKAKLDAGLLLPDSRHHQHQFDNSKAGLQRLLA